MKKIFSILIIALFAIVAKAQITKGTLQASGLTCSMCNLSIMKSLQKLPFIDSIVPNIEAASYELTFKEGANVNFQGIKNAVEKAGFSVAQISFTIKPSGVEFISNNSFKSNGFTYNIIGNNQQFNGAKGLVNFYITDKGFLSEKKYKKFKNSNKESQNETIINIKQV